MPCAAPTASRRPPSPSTARAMMKRASSQPTPPFRLRAWLIRTMRTAATRSGGRGRSGFPSETSTALSSRTSSRWFPRNSLPLPCTRTQGPSERRGHLSRMRLRSRIAPPAPHHHRPPCISSPGTKPFTHGTPTPSFSSPPIGIAHPPRTLRLSCSARTWRQASCNATSTTRFGVAAFHPCTRLSRRGRHSSVSSDRPQSNSTSPLSSAPGTKRGGGGSRKGCQCASRRTESTRQRRAASTTTPTICPSN